MGLNRLTGTPWHLDKYTREDGDERRHRSRCVYYKKPDAHCSFHSGKCRGSAHCPYYREYNPETDAKPEPMPEPKKKSSIIKYEKILATKDGKKAFVSSKEEQKLFPVGCRVRHMSNGKGTVKKVSNGKITVAFDSGKEIMLSLDVCVRKGLLIQIDSNKRI